MKDPVQIKKVQGIEEALEKQVDKLDKILLTKQTKGCNDENARLASNTGYPLKF